MRLERWPLVALLVVVAALAASGCGGGDGDGDGEQATGRLNTISEGKLRVGSDIPYPPFEFGGAPDYEGFDVDLVREIGKRLDLEVEFVDTPFNQIFRNLARGRFDMVASGSTITEERKRIVDFSDPYLPADQSLLVKKGSDIKSEEDLDEKTVGAQLGSTGSMYARDNTDAIIRNYHAITDAFNALEAGQVDAVINDFPTSKDAADKRKELQIVQTIPTGEPYGLAFSKESDRLREAVNRVVRDIKDDGTYARMYRKWFDSDPPENILRANGT